jgi:hypothetical protein
LANACKYLFFEQVDHLELHVVHLLIFIESSPSMASLVYLPLGRGHGFCSRPS